MKIALIGANGQLGSDLAAVLASDGAEIAALTHAQIKVEDPDSVASALGGIQPEVILNTAADHNVPRCETDPERAFAVNAQGALNVARVAADLGAVNVYFSTDYVFDGESERPYTEDDLPRPLNVYGASKTAGESLTLAYCPQSLVVRISGIYGLVPCRAKGENMVTKMVGLAGREPEVRVVTDEVLTPTPTLAIARRLGSLVATGASGIYHLSCEGCCSWYDFVREVFDLLGIETPLLRASVDDFPSPVRRPRYSVLENRAYNALGLDRMLDWREGLREYLESWRPQAIVRGQSGVR